MVGDDLVEEMREEEEEAMEEEEEEEEEEIIPTGLGKKGKNRLWVKEGYKYFPCANEYKTEEEIAIGGEKEAWRVTKLSNREFGRTRAQTQELEVANAMEELSSSNELENRRKEAAKVDAATSLFVLREVEKRKAKLCTLRGNARSMALWRCTNARYIQLQSKKLCWRSWWKRKSVSSYNFVVREINKLIEEEKKLFEEKKKLREKEDAKIIEIKEKEIADVKEKLYPL